MKKIISLLLVLIMLLSVSLFTVSCGGDMTPEKPEGNPPEPIEKDEKTQIVVPAEKDYGRGTVDYSQIVYERPDYDGVCDAFAATTALIAEGKVEYSKMLDAILALEDGYEKVRTMYTLAEINNMKDSRDEYWLGEYTYVSTAYPAFTQAIEELFVAAAQSQYAENFENDYFGEGLIEEYADGGIYSDAVVLLLEEEARLEAEYSALSTSTVEITYTAPDNKVYTGTYDELVEMLGGSHSALILPLYQEKVTEISADLMVELVKVRRLIADELGLESYTEYAYSEMGYDYSEEKVLDMLGEIYTTVYPVYMRLYTYVFDEFFYTTKENSAKYSSMINRLYATYQTLDSDIADVFAYMLQHGLYDIEYAEKNANRYEGAFTTYLDTNNSPFLFVTASGKVSDYLTFSHEFGHFLDFYVNDGNSASLDLAEVYSQAFELITMLKVKGALGEEAGKYIEYTAIIEAMDTIVYQGFLAYYEHLLYELDYNEITKEELGLLVDEASIAVCGNPIFASDYSVALIPHTILYPHYVQSYCTSMISALSIFFEEVEEDGKGLEIYKTLLSREEDKTFEEYLELAGAKSPFEEGSMLDIADKLHYYILGVHYVKDEVDNGV